MRDVSLDDRLDSFRALVYDDHDDESNSQSRALTEASSSYCFVV